MKDPPVRRMRSLFISLLLSMIILIVCIVGFISINSYVYSKNNFERESTLLQVQTEQNIIEAMRLEEITWNIYDETLNSQMKDGLTSVLLEYNRTGGDPRKMDLTKVKNSLGKNYDIYVINGSGVIISTTYLPELGMDFRQVPYFYDYLTKIRMSEGFFPDRIVREKLGAGQLRKFAYMPTPDHLYILELGFSSPTLDTLNEQLDDKNNIQKIVSVNPYVEEFTIFNSMGRRLDNNSLPDKTTQGYINEVLKNRETIEVRDPGHQRTTTYLMVNLKVDKYGSDPSRVVAITYNLQLIRDDLNRLIFNLFVTVIAALIIGCVLAYEISRRITGPIQKIVADVNIIAHGDLDHRIGPTQSSEFVVLENSTNIMVDSLKKALQQVKDEEKLRMEIIDQLPVAVFMKTGKDGRYLFWNKASERIFEIQASEVIGKSDRDLFSKDWVSVIEQEDLIAIRDHILISNKKISNKSQGQRIIHIVIVPIFNSENTLQYILGIAEDMTDETRNLKRELLFSLTRRDILDQLLVIVSYLERAQLKATHEEMQIFFDKTIESIESIRKQMAFGKSLQDMEGISPTWQLVQRSWYDAIKLLPAHTVDIGMEMADIELYADTLLSRVFYNLMINSLHHGGHQLTKIRLYTKKSAESLILVYEDNGTGIPLHKKEKIFEFGYGKDAGLGLFLVREILGNTGITITETGEPGKGVRFEILIPKGKFRFTA
ncbi:MAG: PAS domain-containing protein [Methanoregula sp.]|nr:PAS domain-containing protein [Methanoregula sp.]